MSLIKKVGRLIHGIFAVAILIINCILCFIPILLIGFLKLFPYKPWQLKCTQMIDSVVTLWCATNNLYVDKILGIQWQITGLENLNRKDWYLVIANHQSWLDIVILQRLFNRKIPVLKFFIKDQLKWVPLLGFAWWAMGCPFMKRYSKAYLARNPHKEGKDLLSTRKAVESFKKTPASIMNFVEGTRFSKQKKLSQNSPYDHLLKPKAGGISFIISAMGEQINSMLDVTIVYPQRPSLWDFLCRRLKSITINIRHIPIPQQFTSSHLLSDNSTQADFKEWLNATWAEKDTLITSLK